jgi:thiol-disulfide isomerase/thioredoxin
MSKNLVNIPYVEGNDVNDDGSLKSHVGKGLPVLIMVQGNFCGYCTKAKPDFQKLENNGEFMVATVQIDGGDTDKMANNKLSKVISSKGVPAYACFNKNGKFVKMHNGGRDAESLKKSMKNL